MVKERLTIRDKYGKPVLKSYAIDAQMAAVRKLAEYEDAEEEKRKRAKRTTVRSKDKKLEENNTEINVE